LLVFSLGACAAFAQAQIKTLAVYPFSSQNVVLGVAVAAQVSESLGDELSIYGPAVTPALAPPLIAENGFLNPLVFLNQSADVDTADGAELVRGALGVDALLSGVLKNTDKTLELTLYLATKEGVKRFTASAPEDQPGLLAYRAEGVLSVYLGVAPPQKHNLDLSGPGGDYAKALTLLSGGFLEEARTALEKAVQAEPGNAHWQKLLTDLKAVMAGKEGRDPAFMATASLSLKPLNSQLAIHYFSELGDSSQALPAATTWVATLKASVNDREGANKAFDAAARLYPYGLAARAVYRAVGDLPGAKDDLASLAAATEPAALLGATVAAQDLKDDSLEKPFATALSHRAPTLAYPFERLSFIAFNQHDPLAALEALTVAVKLEPKSDLYWTNLGWAYYLLDSMDKSVQASEQAVKLNPSEAVAWYNLGLAHAVGDDLSDAMDAYQQALAIGTEVNGDAVNDLENALKLHPQSAGVHFALGTLYEAQGKKDAAETQFTAYLKTGTDDAFKNQASQRLKVLRAPPPPLKIEGGVTVGLGPDQFSAAPYHPGDVLYPKFEVSTPGLELPNHLTVKVQLLHDGDEVQGASVTKQLRVENNVVATAVKDLGLTLPDDLLAGSYTLRVTATANPGNTATAKLKVPLSGKPSLLRELLGHGITLEGLDGQPLSSQDQLTGSGADAALTDALVTELHQNADAAEKALPTATQGRFKGLSGGELFKQSQAADVRDFLHYLLASGAHDAQITFLDAYAQWALEKTSEAPSK
jgi:tetratricopeptide (TPR) repeat protein